MTRAQVEEQTSLGLSARESEVMSLIAGGHTNGEIAARTTARPPSRTGSPPAPRARRSPLPHDVARHALPDAQCAPLR
jgi:hypothetical protein